MRFVRNALIFGLPFGLIMTVIMGLIRPGWLLLLGGLGAITLQGTIGALLVWPIHRWTRWYVGCGLSVALALSGSLIAMGLAILAIPSPEPPVGAWQRLPRPPETTAEILGHGPFDLDGGDLYIRADSGTIYTYHDSSSRGSWRRESAFPPSGVEDQSYWERTPEQPFPTRRPPGRVLDDEAVYVRAPELYMQIHYVLLENGSLWRSRRRADAYLYLGLMVWGALFGALIGFAEGMIAPRIVERRDAVAS